ncbi:developmentally regulated gtp-binding protein-related [Holotrichia oblita]|nr:developmentally regulated gtp-binding protein-related [Holotrichia oblita]
MFIDRVKINIKAGDGGDGGISFYTEKYVEKGGPDGGDGGRGGDLIFKADPDKNSLYDITFQAFYRAENGENGMPKYCFGKNGKNFVIKVPTGTVIRDAETGGIIADLYQPDSEIVVLKGGSGGKGNARFKSSRRQAPRFSQTGRKTEEHTVILELKTIADVGLIGYPNVGKSTLLSMLTAARPKIANYHFTTLSPNLGICAYHDNTFIIADIPGLIEGAGKGLGLGHEFLRHIERTRMLVHLVDISAEEGRDPYKDYMTINAELNEYNSKLIDLPQIVALSKIDGVADPKSIKKFIDKLKKKNPDIRIVPICSIMGEGLEELKKNIFEVLSCIPKKGPLEFEPFEYTAPDISEFDIERDDDGAYVIFGGMIDEFSRGVVLSDMESLRYLQKKLKENGVFKALRKMGIKDGDTVRILDVEFDFVE